MRKIIIFLSLVIISFLTNVINVGTIDFDLVYGPLPYLSYPYGLKCADEGDIDVEAYLLAEYEEWKSHYVVTDTATGFLRVQRDAATNYDTVSEGMGYGLLLAVYFNDQATFDSLLSYVDAHLDGTHLMHWIITADGVEVSEFGIPIDHETVYIKVDPVTKMPIDPPEYELEKEGDPNYLQASNDRRSTSSATDADVDMAAALLLAHARWGGYHSSYFEKAVQMIVSIACYDVMRIGAYDYWLKAGNRWGGLKGWNPCYFTPTWWSMFKKALESRCNIYGIDRYIPNCEGVLRTMWREMQEIDAVNDSTGLYPDWVNTDGTTPVKPSELSDRRYYLDIDPVDGYADDRNGDGVITYDDGYDMQSFNYYYDAVRVPWRMGMEYSQNGSGFQPGTFGAYDILTEMASFFSDKNFPFEGEGDPATDLVDGYSITGGPWNWNDRDGFNNGVGGKSYSATHIAMDACFVLAMEDKTIAKQFYDAVKAKKDDYDGKYNYYGNTVRLLSLLYLSGKMYNFCDMSNWNWRREEQDMLTYGPLMIDLAYTDFALYGTHNASLNDRAKLLDESGSGYSDMGAGIKDEMLTGNLIIGSDSELDDAICGLSRVFDRTRSWSPRTVHGWIIGRGEAAIQMSQPYCDYGMVFPLYYYKVIENLNHDPGCMDFSIERSAFRPNPNRDRAAQNGGYINVSPGRYGDVTAGNNGARIYLSSGNYHMERLKTEPDAKIFFDTSSGPIVIFITEELDIKSRTKFLQMDGSLEIPADASKILIVVATSNTVYLAPQVSWRGTLIAPNTNYLNADIGRSGEFYGAVWGKNVQVHQDTVIHFVKFDWDALR